MCKKFGVNLYYYYFLLLLHTLPFLLNVREFQLLVSGEWKRCNRKRQLPITSHQSWGIPRRVVSQSGNNWKKFSFQTLLALSIKSIDIPWFFSCRRQVFTLKSNNMWRKLWLWNFFFISPYSPWTPQLHSQCT